MDLRIPIKIENEVSASWTKFPGDKNPIMKIWVHRRWAGQIGMLLITGKIQILLCEIFSVTDPMEYLINQYSYPHANCL